jgi:hypothetical protein
METKTSNFVSFIRDSVQCDFQMQHDKYPTYNELLPESHAACLARLQQLSLQFSPLYHQHLQVELYSAHYA